MKPFTSARFRGRVLFPGLLLGLGASLLLTPGVSAADWPQWGGPGRDFQAEAAPLNAEWPEGGPKELWRRDLGDGNSAITVVGDRLYTMYRNGEREVVVALDRGNGQTVWESSWDAPPWEEFYAEYGPGPHTTPLVAEGRLYATGYAGRLVCLDAATGEELWSRDLWEGVDLGAKEFGPAQLGYSASPLLHDGRLIVVGGDRTRSVLALDPKTGQDVWVTAGLEPAFASPIAIAMEGEEQIVAFVADEVVGLRPGTGEILWRAPHKTDYLVNASTPLWNGDDTLVISSAYGTGSRGIRLHKSDNGYEAKEIWATPSFQIHHQASVLLGDQIVGSSGDFGPAFLGAVDLQTGAIRFRDRGFAKANVLASGDQLIILDEDGVLALGALGEDGVEIEAKAQVFKSRSWTVPTLVGSTLYARDRQEIASFDLSEQ